MVDGLSRFTSDRRSRGEATWTDQTDWETGLAEGVDISEDRLVGRPSGYGGGVPDSAISRPDDDNSGTNSNKYGLRIRTSQVWALIGAEISGNVSGATRAMIFRVGDGELMGESDISGLGPGDTFIIDGVDLSPGVDYNFVLDGGGDGYTYGYLYSNNVNYPYTSPDGNLEIVNGGSGETGTNAAALNLKRVGKVGFD